MRKLYSALLSTVLTLSAFTAKADNVDVTITCNHSDAAYIYYSYYVDGTSGSVQTDLNEGDNEFSIPEYTSVSVYAKDGYLLTSMTSSQVYPSLSSTTYGNFFINSASSYSNGVSVDVVAKTPEEAYDGTITLNVDDPSKVQAQFSSSYRNALTNVEADTDTEVTYITGSESTLYIASSDYNSTLYQVKQNDNVVSAYYGRYTLSLTNGDRIEIKANYPDTEASLAFTYSEKGEGVITGVTVNGETVEDFANGIIAKVGDKVSLTIDNTNYKFNSIQLNGSTLSYYGYGTCDFQLVEEENTIYVDATKYETFSATVNVDAPERVTVTRPLGNSSETLSLVAGDNEMTFTSGQNNTLTITPATDCYISSVTDGTNEYYTAGSTRCEVTIEEGQTITITSGRIQRDHKAVLYIDDLSIANYNNYLQRSTRTNVAISTGYNIIEFDDSDNPFQAGFYGSSMQNGHFYLNGEEITPTSTSETSIYFGSLTFADGDIAKFYFAGEPSTYNVTFDISQDIRTYFQVYTDILTEQLTYPDGFQAMTGTQVDITNAIENATVSVNGEAIDPVDGVYTFTVNADTAVEISAGQSGVESVSVANENSNVSVYNLQGVKLLNNASADQLRSLPAGIYIVNGKKQVVK